MAKKKTKTLEELFPDAELREPIKQQLYSRGPLLGEGSVFSEMLQAMVNASLDGEMQHFQEEQKAAEEDNRRNGYTTKEVRSTAGKLEVHTPRDRNGGFEPLLIGKRQRSLPSGMEDIIISLYARGNSVDDIRYQLQQLYGAELSTGLISSITESVWEEVLAFLAFGQHIRRMIYTTNPVEALHRVLRKVTKSKGAWVSGRALLKQLYLALMHNEKSWKRITYNWKAVQRELLERFGEAYGKYLE